MPGWYGTVVFVFGLALFCLSMLGLYDIRRRERRIARMLQDVSDQRARIHTDRKTVIGYLEDKHRKS